MHDSTDLERVLGKFESALRSGDRPTIEDFLTLNPNFDRTAMLAQLVLVEAHFRQECGESPTRDEYVDRYPDLANRLGEFPAPSDPSGDTISMQVDRQDTATYVPTVDGTPPPQGHFEDYDLIEELGRGGMGVVYKAYQRSLKRLVALKTIRSGELAGHGEVERFIAEARAAARLDHPGIVPVFEVGEHAGRPFFAMGYVEGHTLADQVRSGPLAPRRAAELLVEVASAVHYAHEQGIVHRDLKPSNVLLDGNGAPRVMDFGLAKTLEEEHGMTMTGDVLGTPAYMPPEQAEGRTGDVGIHSDIYSLGAILYQLLTGRPPFAAASLHETLSQVINSEPVPPRQLNPEVPRDLETVCLKCLQKSPSSRYTSAGELVDDLRRYLAGRPIAARRIGSTERAWRWCRRNPATALAIGIGAIAVVSMAALLVAIGYQSELQTARTSAENLASSESQLRRTAESLAADKSELAELERRQRKNAELATEQEKVQRTRAEAAERNAIQARETLDRILFSERLVTADSYLKAPEINVTRARRLLDECPTHLRAWDWHYVDAHLHKTCTNFQGHTNRVECVRFSPDGNTFASGGQDKSIKIWDVNSKRALHTLLGHDDVVQSLDFSPTGMQLVSGSLSGEIKIWDVSTGREIRSLDGHEDLYASVCFSRDGKQVVSGGGAWSTFAGGRTRSPKPGPGRVAVWNAATGLEVASLEGHMSGVSSVCISSDGTRIVSGDTRGTIKVWDTESKQQVLSIPSNRNLITSICFSPDGTQIAAGHGLLVGPGVITVWDATSGAKQQSLRGHSGPITSVCFSPDGHHILSSSTDRSVKSWNVASGTCVYTLQGHDGNVRGLACHSSGSTVVSVGGVLGRPGEIKVWHIEGDRLAKTLSGHTGSAPSIHASPDGKHLVSGGKDGIIRIWNVQSGRELHSWDSRDRSVECVRFSADGLHMASSGLRVEEDRHAAYTIRIWNSVTGREIQSFDVGRMPVSCVRFSPDGKRLAASFGFGWKQVKIWNVESGREELTLKCEAEPFAFSPDGECIVASGGILATVWSTDSGDLLDTWRVGLIQCLAFSPDGSRVVSGDWSGVLTVRDAVTGDEIESVDAHSGPVFDLWFCDDGSRLVTGGGDGAVRVWDAMTMRRTLTVQCANSNVESVCCGRNGDWIACSSGFGEGSLTVWSSSNTVESNPEEGLENVAIKGRSPSWSPKGDKVVYQAQTPGTSGLVVGGLDGRGQVTIPGGFHPAWSPAIDGPIAFVRPDQDDGKSCIWLAEPDGSRHRRVAKGMAPSWSRDGKTLFFVQVPNLIALSMAPGAEIRTVMKSYPFSAVSPDGKKVAAGWRGAVVVTEVPSGKVVVSRRIEGLLLEQPGWSPDSRYIGFGLLSRKGLWIMNATSGEVFEAAPGSGRRPRWSPNGRWIAYDELGRIKVLRVEELPWPVEWEDSTGRSQ